MIQITMTHDQLVQRHQVLSKADKDYKTALSFFPNHLSNAHHHAVVRQIEKDRADLRSLMTVFFGAEV